MNPYQGTFRNWGRPRGGDRSLIIGWLKQVDRDILASRGYTEEEIHNIFCKQDHPILGIRVENPEGAEGLAIHSLTSNQRIEEMLKVNARADTKDGGHYLHLQGDVDPLGENPAFKYDRIKENKQSLEMQDEVQGTLDGLLVKNEKMKESLQFSFSTNCETMLVDQQLLNKLRVNEHHLDWSYNFNEGDLPHMYYGNYEDNGG